jgi:SAM-dependent methyltransferase
MMPARPALGLPPIAPIDRAWSDMRYRPGMGSQEGPISHGPRAGDGGWDSSYTDGRPPWDTGRPQPVFLLAADSMRSPVLDAGCGTGENALALAERGSEIVGLDIAPSAVAQARRKTSERGLLATFIVGDALELDGLGRRFATVIDSGLFHTFPPELVSRYVESLHRALEPDGVLYLLCFSDRQPGTMGPRRVAEAELRDAFALGWRIESIEPAAFETLYPAPSAAAWFARITRLPEPG